MSVLSDHSIMAQSIEHGLIEPFSLPQLQPASYDLRLGDIRGWSLEYEPRWIYPKEFILGSTQEVVSLPANIVGRLEGKSSIARNGIIIHTAGFVDPGFRGQLTLEITNLSDEAIPLSYGMLIAQIAFQWLDEPANRPYGHPDLGSHYQDQHGATPAKI